MRFARRAAEAAAARRECERGGRWRWRLAWSKVQDGAAEIIERTRVLETLPRHQRLAFRLKDIDPRDTLDLTSRTKRWSGKR